MSTAVPKSPACPANFFWFVCIGVAFVFGVIVGGIGAIGVFLG